MKRNTYQIPYSIFVNGEEYPKSEKFTDVNADEAVKQLIKKLKTGGNDNYHIGDPIIVK